MRLKWKLVWVHLEIVVILTQDRCMDCAKCTIRLKNYFGHTLMELLGDVGHVESRFGPFG
jgi:protein tyrosine phosphatase